MTCFRVTVSLLALVQFIGLTSCQRNESAITMAGGRINDTRWEYDLVNRSEEPVQLLVWRMKDGRIEDLRTREIPGGDGRQRLTVQLTPGVVEVSGGSSRERISSAAGELICGWDSSEGRSSLTHGLHALWHAYPRESSGEWRGSMTYNVEGLDAFLKLSREQPSVVLYGVGVLVGGHNSGTGTDSGASK